MRVYQNIDQLPLFRKAVITIGTFDGVHPGHRQIFHQMKEEAAAIGGETVIVTFHPHPRKIVTGRSGALYLLTTMQERIFLLNKLGIDHLVIVPFTPDFAEMSAEEYITHFLINRFHPHTIIIGYDHRFGKNRSGDYLLLEKLVAVFGCLVKEIPEKLLNEVTVSSTIIRESLLKGEINKANQFLGYAYFFEAKVVHGQKLGREIGYPTANLELTDPEKLIPADGVYAVTVAIANQSAFKEYKGMLNIGFRPTVDGSKRMIEVHIFEFSGDLYGSTVTIYFHHYIREEIRFPDLDSLRKKLDEDKTEAQRLLLNYSTVHDQEHSG